MELDLAEGESTAQAGLWSARRGACAELLGWNPDFTAVLTSATLGTFLGLLVFVLFCLICKIEKWIFKE